MARIPGELQVWIDARKRYRLSDAQVQNPPEFSTRFPLDQRRLPQFPWLRAGQPLARGAVRLFVFIV